MGIELNCPGVLYSEMNMSDLYTHFCQQLQPYRQRHFVLALSGGVDSRVLLDLLVRYRNDFSASIQAVHVHHGLSENADDWAMLCQKWCDESSVDLTVEHVSLDTSCGESIEKLARDARYQVLSKYVQLNDVLLLGQHADDQIETFLLALKRGSGPKGLSSMAMNAPFAKGGLLRPLLEVKRAEIESYAEALSLDWVSDESNSDVRYERNFIRHQITPLLTQRWPSIHHSLQRTTELCAEQESLLEELLQARLTNSLEVDGSLKINALLNQSESVRRQLIRQWLSKHSVMMPSRKHTDMIWQEVALAVQDANPKLKIGESEIRRYDNRLYCVAITTDISGWKSGIVVEQSLELPDGLGAIRFTSGNGSIRLPEDTSKLWGDH